MIDEYGEGLYPDLLRYYGVNLYDVIAGNGPSPSAVLALAGALPSDSLTAALVAGGRQFFGWNESAYLLSHIYDLEALAIKANGNWPKGKQPDIPAFPRPKKLNESATTPDGEKPKTTVASLFRSMTTRGRL